MTQCERLETELRKGRKLTKLDIDALLIGNHTGRIADLRKKGLKIKTEYIPTQQGTTGLYSLEQEAIWGTKRPDHPGPEAGSRYRVYVCEKGHEFLFYGEGGEKERCDQCNWREFGTVKK